MAKEDPTTGLVCTAIIIMIGIGVLSAKISYQFGKEAGYKDACVDFYKGKPRMSLVENPDGTREWKPVK